MGKKSSLLDQIASDLPSRGPLPIMERLPADLAAEMNEVRAAWRAGDEKLAKATKTGLGRLIAKHLRARGVSIGEEAVVRWLQESG